MDIRDMSRGSCCCMGVQRLPGWHWPIPPAGAGVPEPGEEVIPFLEQPQRPVRI